MEETQEQDVKTNADYITCGCYCNVETMVRRGSIL